jgi:hypothetical protein
MTWGNCWFWALWKYWREGGYLVVRRSKYIPVPHVMWTNTMKGKMLWEFHPLRPKTGFIGIISSPFFRGVVRKIKEK